MRPEIHLLGLTVQSFGLMLGIALLTCGVIAARRLRELGRPVDWAYEMLFAAAIGGLVGARLWWVAETGGSLLGATGLVFYGGLIGGAVIVLAWAAWRGVLDLHTIDLAAVPLAAGYAIGRIGCQLAGDGDYGRAWDGPWAMAYPHGTVPTTTPVHPTPVYETLAMAGFAVWLWRRRDAWPPGTLFAVYLIGAGLERFLVEFLRRNPDASLGLTAPQLLAAACVLGGAVWLALRSILASYGDRGQLALPGRGGDPPRPPAHRRV